MNLDKAARQVEVSLLVKLARMASREAVKWDHRHPLRERNKGRVGAFMEAARYLDGWIISTGMKRWLDKRYA